MASGPITSWEMDGETVETVADFIFLRRGSQGASRVVLGTSGLRACGEGECVIALES